MHFPAFSPGSTRQPKESVQFVYNEPEVFTEGPDLQTGEAEMALYRSHVRHAAGPERAAGYHEVLCTIRSWQLIHVGNRRSKSFIILGHRLSTSSARGSLRLIFHALRGPCPSWPANVILGVVSPHSRKIYIQNLSHYANAFYFCAFHENL